MREVEWSGVAWCRVKAERKVDKSLILCMASRTMGTGEETTARFRSIFSSASSPCFALLSRSFRLKQFDFGINSLCLSPASGNHHRILLFDFFR